MVTLYIHNYEIGFTKFNMWFIKKNGKWIGQSGRCNSRHMIKPYDVLKILRLQDIDCMEWIVEDPSPVFGTEPVYDIDTGEVILQCKPRTPFEIFNAMKNKVRIEIRCDALPTEADPYTIYIKTPMHPDASGYCEAYIKPDGEKDFYKILCNPITGSIKEVKDER